MIIIIEISKYQLINLLCIIGQTEVSMPKNVLQ